MEKQTVGLQDLLASGSWYAIPALWGLIAFIRMALMQGGILAITSLVALTVIVVWFSFQMLIQKVRTGKQPTKEQQESAFRAILNPVFSVIWAGFATGCIAIMILVVEMNDPFTKELVDHVIKEHTALFWAVMVIGVTVGASGRIWNLSRSGQVGTAKKTGEACAPTGETHP
jgi:hypothetical protein